jgi:hypothetical protein
MSLLCASMLWAQRYRGGRGRAYYDADSIRTAREVESGSTGTPTWTNPPAFQRDVFTFVRVRYESESRGWGRRGGWHVDLPDSDLNLSYRLQQMTSIKVDPDGRIVDLTESDLFDFPFLYMVEPGALRFDDLEVAALRKYLLNGGFLMADDFWGDEALLNFEQEIKRVLPERSFVELPMDHPLFHCVFELGSNKNALQTPNFETGEQSQYTGVTWERGEDGMEVHIRAILDEKGRIMVLACHNTDNGDGWEREGEYKYFFHEFSEKRAYPLGVNIVYYAMTH